jgi:hypothetical protein
VSSALDPDVRVKKKTICDSINATSDGAVCNMGASAPRYFLDDAA